MKRSILSVTVVGESVPELETLEEQEQIRVRKTSEVSTLTGPTSPEFDVVVAVYSSGTSQQDLLELPDQLPERPLVLIDIDNRDDFSDRAIEAGYQDYLAQPDLTVPLLERSLRYAFERWETNRELREQEEQFRQLTEHINEIFLLSDLETGEFLHVSSALQTIWGKDPENLYQNPEQLTEAIHPEDREQVRNARSDGDPSGDLPDLEYRVVDEDGSVRWVRDKARIIRDDRGNPYRMARVIEDNTKTKALEKDLKRSNEDLQNFAYVISHDLQEPLRMITGYLELLDERFAESLDEKAQKYIHEAVNGAERMKGMISDLLTYSRVKTRGKPFEPVDASTVLDDIMSDFQQAIEAKDATVEYGDLPTVLADRGQLRHLFQNLIENGIKFAGEEDPRIRIATTRRGDRWEFQVEDNGIGIDPQNQDDVFVIFRQLQGETYGGTGLGLALCKRIVERHGGEIRVESDGENGSTFIFTLKAGPEE